MIDYVAVSCSRYTSHELAIRHRRLFRLIWTDGRLLHCRLDLQPRGGGEFSLRSRHRLPA